MTPDEIALLPVPTIAAPNSVCFLWATVPLGADPYRVLFDWGYTFKTEWFWHKQGRKGTGYWTRGCVEKVLVGVRGHVKAWRSNLDNWLEDEALFESVPQGHSRKPKIVRDYIEQLTPGALRVELFATERPAGWHAYGLELDPRDNFLTTEFWERVRGREDPPVPVPAAAATPLVDPPATTLDTGGWEPREPD